MRPPRIMLLVAVVIVPAILIAAWLGHSSRPSATVFFQPLGRATNADGTAEQSFGISNYTASTVEFVFGRYKVSTAPGGQRVNDFKPQIYFQLPPYSGTQAALTLPGENGSWHAALGYRRVVGQTELAAKMVGYRLNLLYDTSRQTYFVPGNCECRAGASVL